MAVFLSALELSIVGTALPTIVHDLQGDNFVWVGSAYALTSAAFMPTAGGLSNIFGRRALMLNSIAFFTTGAAIAGSARSMNMLIAARGLYGLFYLVSYTGSSGATVLSHPRRRRGRYYCFIGGHNN